MGMVEAVERLWGLGVTAFGFSYLVGAAWSGMARRLRRTATAQRHADTPRERLAARLARRWWGWEIDRPPPH